MALKLVPYLVMDGNAKEAILFYEKAFGANLLYQQTFGEMPENPDFPPLPEAAKERVAHAMLKVGETDLMFSDTFPGQPHKTGNQVTICISSDDPTRSREIFEALQQDGTVNMELQETHFSPAYGIVVDKFGVCFQIYTEGKS
ncbi:PhnB protein [Marininema mesophilum]|uniref:PhnB protein n=1 Tax=Marininema mesophilum TaxID=1048340 RepID=A0A1H2ZKF9_9BACL|nr:VOC family protein [Marininema mesophilum]SDX17871.1 PhnB protein [Marininema mesophilum]